jgi:HEAT repeat protein
LLDLAESIEATMRFPSLFRGLRVAATLAVVVVLLMCRPTVQISPPFDSTVPSDTVDFNIRQLSAPEGKVKYLFFINPGGPVFDYSVPMKKLVEQGSAIQPRLFEELKDPRIRNEVALILAKIGDKDALPRLIHFLPTKEKLTEEEEFSTTCVLYALWQLTGMELGIHHKFSPKYRPEFRKKWQTWHDSNKDYLYSPSKPKRTAYNWGRDRVLVDLEARFAAKSTTAYRKEHPWIAYEDIKTWREDPAYEQKLKDFCFSIIVNLTWNPYGYAPGEAISSLGRIHDPRALSALHALCALADDSFGTHGLIWTLAEKGDLSSIPFLLKIPRSRDVEPERAIERIRLLEKYRKELKGKPFDSEEQTIFMRCLESSKGVDELIANLRSRESDSFLSHYLRVAGCVDREPVRTCLKEMASDGSRDARARTMVHGALAQLGEKGSLNHLKQSLTHQVPGVRLAAAEWLWYLGRRDGFKTLVELLNLRPIESGGEGVEVGDGSFTVTAIRDSNVDYIRSACKILGEMGDRSAIEPLKRLLPMNLNGVSATGGSGTGWPGRPDAVALAKLGDFSGIAVLRASISKGDPLNVVGSWPGSGDFVAIGQKRFIPEILPMLDNREEEKRVLAAQAILLLLERGR